MKKILFATGNPSKVKRFENALKEKGIEIVIPNNLDIDIEVKENGKDAIENASIKARAYSKVVDIPVFAMDDNLYIENVPEEKQPGMFVRRVNGKRLSDDEMINHYIGLVKEYGINGKLVCRWVYGICVINNEKESTYTWTKDDFYMVDKCSDKINPGYPLNSISINKELNKYFTDITEEDKVKASNDESNVIDFIYNCVKD